MAVDPSYARSAAPWPTGSRNVRPLPGPPRPDPTPSFWQMPPGALANARTTAELPATADVIVIGSGMTGASVAYGLVSQPSAPSVVLLEARTACSGATGRNGGHTKAASFRSYLQNVDVVGVEAAVEIARFEYQCMKAVHAFARQQGIQCDSWEGDTADVFYSPGEWDLAKRAIAALQNALGSNDPAARYTFWSADEARTKFLAPTALGAITYEAGSISGYKFVMGILEVAVAQGLNLQTETPVQNLTRIENGWTVNTPRGTISAAQVVMATNGYTAHLYPKLHNIIVPKRGHMSAQYPGSRLPAGGLATTYSYVYNGGYEYMIQRPQGTDAAGRIMIGGADRKAPDGGIREWGDTDDTTSDPIIVKLLEDCSKEYFGKFWGDDHSCGRLSHFWTGIMGFSRDGNPLVGQIPDEQGLFIAASFQGHGMVLCWLAAMGLVQMMTGQNDVDTVSIPKAFIVTSDRMNMNCKD